MLIIILLHDIVWVTGCLNISGSYWRVLARSWTRRIVLTTAGQSSQDYSGPRNTGGTLGPGLVWWQLVVQYWPSVTLTGCSYEIRDMRYEISWEIIRDMRDNTAAPDLSVVLLGPRADRPAAKCGRKAWPVLPLSFPQLGLARNC